MNRCAFDDDKCWERRRELSAEDAFVCDSLDLEDVLPGEAIHYLHHVTDPGELRELATWCRIGLTPLQFLRFAEAAEALFGRRFARQSGLPTKRPQLSLAV